MQILLVNTTLQKKWITKKALEQRDAILSGTKNKKEQYAASCYEVMVHKLCQEKCFFCSQDHASRTTDIKPVDREIFKRILYGAKKWYWMLGFTWWEPLIHPNIFRYIQFGRKAGFKLVRIQTNGVMLWNPWFADKCVDAWATLFKFSIHHYKPEIHDYLVQLPWALEKCIAWIKILRERWARMGINIVLTEQNYRDLPEFLLYFLELWVRGFVIIFPLYENSMKDEAKKVWFKFTDATPYIIKSLHIFDKLWLKRPLVLNLPMCLLPWYESAIIQTFNGTAVLNLDWSKTNIDDNKAWWKKRVKICKNCEHNKICFWVDEKYLDFWWENEFEHTYTEKKYSFDFDDLHMKEYFSEDELCFFELLTKKEELSIEDIMSMKDTIQICQDCDSMNKIVSTGEILIKKWYIEKEMRKWKVIYRKL